MTRQDWPLVLGVSPPLTCSQGHPPSAVIPRSARDLLFARTCSRHPVLLSDPWACSRFAEHDVCGSVGGDQRARSQAPPPRAGMSSPARRCVCSTICAWKYGRLDQPIPVGTQGGTLHVELITPTWAVLPAGSHRQQRLGDLELRRQPRRRGKRVTRSAYICCALRPPRWGWPPTSTTRRTLASPDGRMHEPRPLPRYRCGCSPMARSTWSA